MHINYLYPSHFITTYMPERNSTHKCQDVNYTLFVIVKSQKQPKDSQIIIHSNNGQMYIVKTTTALHINTNKSQNHTVELKDH